MRTLSRPMFNMGGPIKQGIMNGIREPHKHGGPTGTGLVGDQRYPKTGGREHHAAFLAPMLYTAGRALARPFGKWAMQNVPKMFSGPTRKFVIGKGWQSTPGYTGNISQKVFQPSWLGKQFKNDPLAGAAMSGKGFVGGALKKGLGAGKYAFGTPSGLAMTGLSTYMFWPDGTKKTDEEIVQTGGVPGGGDPGMTYTKPGPKKLSEAERKAFANKKRTERVEKYLDMMGYDRSKKTAIADALIDASKIVSDRGTLDLKNINRDLINPVIQATSKRLDKPEQIREAVGLMATKAEIEKDLTKETDALKTKALELQIANAENTLAASQSFEGGLSEFLSSRKGAVAKNELTQMARLLANKHGDSFTVIEDLTKIPAGDNGIYMMGSEIFRVTNGDAKQLA